MSVSPSLYPANAWCVGSVAAAFGGGRNGRGKSSKVTRPARIIGPIDVGQTVMTLAADDDIGQLQVRIGLVAWERLRLAPPYLDDDDRRDAALFELEQLCEPNRTRRIDGDRVVDVTIEDVDTIVARFEGAIER